MHRYLTLVTALSLGLAPARPAIRQPARVVAPDSVTAIDVLLEPDATMLDRAKAANQRLRTMYPTGFAIDAQHQPHISCLQRYVRTGDLDKVYDAVGKVLASEKPASWKLKAVRYDFAIWDKLALTVIVVEPTADLIRYQQRLIDAIAPYTVKTGTAAAFATSVASPSINRPTIEYVAKYVPASSGKKFIPHVTVGVAPPDSVKPMVAEPFDAFTFSPAGAAVFQLGNFGTAAKELKRWNLK
jgi:hypothetical protein